MAAAIQMDVAPCCKLVVLGARLMVLRASPVVRVANMRLFLRALCTGMPVAAVVVVLGPFLGPQVPAGLVVVLVVVVAVVAHPWSAICPGPAGMVVVVLFLWRLGNV